MDIDTAKIRTAIRLLEKEGNSQPANHVWDLLDAYQELTALTIRTGPLTERADKLDRDAHREARRYFRRKAQRETRTAENLCTECLDEEIKCEKHRGPYCAAVQAAKPHYLCTRSTGHTGNHHAFGGEFSWSGAYQPQLETCNSTFRQKAGGLVVCELEQDHPEPHRAESTPTGLTIWHDDQAEKIHVDRETDDTCNSTFRTKGGDLHLCALKIGHLLDHRNHPEQFKATTHWNDAYAEKPE